MIIKQDIFEQLSRYLKGEQSAGELQNWLLVESWGMERTTDKDTQDLVYSILHPIFDCDAGAIDAASLRRQLQQISAEAGHLTNLSYTPSN